ncbi:hypothetical protein BaRGS_00007449 [Batillaria attramentaria]|uniref:Uncharacterized protein n=1 Tax=Batillaria attramentaria TaxID=370345 RepID=A0ABD0LQN3_9CAEN
MAVAHYFLLFQCSRVDPEKVKSGPHRRWHAGPKMQLAGRPPVSNCHDQVRTGRERMRTPTRKSRKPDYQSILRAHTIAIGAQPGDCRSSLLAAPAHTPATQASCYLHAAYSVTYTERTY